MDLELLGLMLCDALRNASSDPKIKPALAAVAW